MDCSDCSAEAQEVRRSDNTYVYLFFFLAGVAVLFLVLAIITKNFVLSLFSMITNFAAAYAAFKIQVPYFFYNQNQSVVIQHQYIVTSVPMSAIFILLGVGSAVYAFFLPFGALAGNEKELKV